jgi:AGZA family xanthine/uracil permease-like MFS transporter
MSYILFVNPMILSDAGMDPRGVLTATVLVCASSTILMGLFCKLPYVLAPGMGLNAFFTYTLVLHQGMTWEAALGATVLSGLIFFVLTLLQVRSWMAESIPQGLRISIAAGIGIFLAFIGFQSAGIVEFSSVTFVRPGELGQVSLIFVFGLILSTLLLIKKIPGALLIGIIATTLLAAGLGHVSAPATILSSPDFHSVFWKFDLLAVLKVSMIAPVFTMLMTDLLDSLSSFMGIAQAANLLDENGQPKNLQKALMVDAFSTTAAGCFGSSAGTVYIESAAGIHQGGRTGITAIVCGLCFLPFLFLGDVALLIPRYATAPALVLVGTFMLQNLKHLKLDRIEDALPAFLAMTLIPLTFSITQGMVWGILAHTALRILGGKWEELNAGLITLSLLCFLILYLG